MLNAFMIGLDLKCTSSCTVHEVEATTMEMLMPHPTLLADVTDQEFAAATATGTVVVDFTAEWCPPCRALAPLLDTVASEMSEARFLRMDTDAQPATMVRLGIRGLPTLVVFRDGVIVDRIIGALPLKALRERLARSVPRSAPTAASA
jgi:thioredoxin 1